MSRRAVRGVNRNRNEEDIIVDENRQLFEARVADLERREMEVNQREHQLVGNSLSFDDVKSVVVPFAGDGLIEVNKWIREFEEFAATAGWMNLQKFVWGKRLISGAAKSVIQAEGATTWDEIKRILLNEFKETLNSAKIHLMLSDRKKRSNESSREYFVAMKEIGNRGNVEFGSVIQYVIAGIEDKEINKIMLYGALNANQFNEKLDLYDLVNSKSKLENFEGHPYLQQPVNLNQQQFSGDNSRFSGYHQHSSGRNQKLKNYSNQYRSRNSPYESQTTLKGENRCFGCGDFGHQVRNCEKNLKVLQNGLKCFKCQGFGHIARDCPTMMQFSSYTSTTSSSVQKPDKTQEASVLTALIVDKYTNYCGNGNVLNKSSGAEELSGNGRVG